MKMYRVAQKVSQYLSIIIKSYEKPSTKLDFFVSSYYKISTRIVLHFRIKYSMCDLFVTSWVAVLWSCNVGKIDVFDKIATENKKEKIWQSKKFFYINLYLKDALGMEFIAC